MQTAKPLKYQNMKYKLLFTFLFLFLFVKAQTPKMYINLVSHNEENYPYLSNPSTFLTVRPNILLMAQLTASKGAKWHLGSDHVLLRSVIQNDNGALQMTTGGTNILKYITDTYPSNVECDPHTHESSYNYADVAKLHDSLGVNPGLVMSGFLYNQLQGIYDWQDYQNPRAGTFFPNYTWAPKIIWGAATPGHTNDPQDYGMWKPESMTSFFNHQPSNHLINYGQGCKLEVFDTTNLANVMAELRASIDAIQSGAAPSNGFYCTSIFFRETYLNTPGFISVKLSALMDSINVLVTENKAEWKFIPEVATIWETTYNSEPFIMDCDLSILIASTNDLNEEKITISPNPFIQSTQINTNTELQNATLSIFNPYGQSLLKIEGIHGSVITIDRKNLPSGVYFILIHDENLLILSQKIIIID